MPEWFLNNGRRCPNSPESWVDVVEATTIDWSFAMRRKNPTTAAASPSATSARRILMVSPSLVWSDQKLASDKPGRVRSPWIVEEAGRVVCFDNPAAMHQHDLPGEPPRFAQIMGGHHDLDAARGNAAEEILLRPVRRRIDTPGWVAVAQDPR